MSSTAEYFAHLGTTEESASEELKAAVKRTEDVVHADLPYEELVKKYDEWAPLYDKDMDVFGNDIAPATIKELVINYTGGDKSSQILDMCGGTGINAKALYDAGYTKIDGVDGSRQMLEEAKKKGVYGKMMVAYLGHDDLPIKDNSYDLVLMVGSLCDGHIKPDCFGCFREIVRVAKPGSHFVGCMFVSCISTTYQQSVEEAMNKLVDEGLWSWVLNDVLPKTGARPADQQQVWVLKIN